MSTPDTPPPAGPPHDNSARIGDVFLLLDRIMTDAVYAQLRLSGTDDLVVWAPMGLMHRLFEAQILNKPESAELRRWLMILASLAYEDVASRLNAQLVAEAAGAEATPFAFWSNADVQRIVRAAERVLEGMPTEEPRDDTPVPADDTRTH